MSRLSLETIKTISSLGIEGGRIGLIKAPPAGNRGLTKLLKSLHSGERLMNSVSDSRDRARFIYFVWEVPGGAEC